MASLPNTSYGFGGFSGPAPTGYGGFSGQSPMAGGFAQAAQLPQFGPTGMGFAQMMQARGYSQRGSDFVRPGVRGPFGLRAPNYVMSGAQAQQRFGAADQGIFSVVQDVQQGVGTTQQYNVELGQQFGDIARQQQQLEERAGPAVEGIRQQGLEGAQRMRESAGTGYEEFSRLRDQYVAESDQMYKESVSGYRADNAALAVDQVMGLSQANDSRNRQMAAQMRAEGYTTGEIAQMQYQNNMETSRTIGTQVPALMQRQSETLLQARLAADQARTQMRAGALGETRAALAQREAQVQAAEAFAQSALINSAAVDMQYQRAQLELGQQRAQLLLSSGGMKYVSMFDAFLQASLAERTGRGRTQFEFERAMA
jgi:hypothetical protein